MTRAALAGAPGVAGSVRSLMHAGVRGDQQLEAAAGGRGLLRERAIRHVPHAHDVQPHVVPGGDAAHHLLLEADLPVRDEHDLALRVVAGERHGLLDGVRHLGAAARL